MSFKLGLIGYPIQHSLSPWIHKQFLEKANLKGIYSIFEVSPSESFSKAMAMLKNEQIDGFNVTAPYKQKIIPFLDKMDDHAKKIGAVNTVLSQNGKWYGYNTDGVGYVRSLEGKYPLAYQNKLRHILLVGAGGAARGIYYALINSGFRNIDIANRTENKAYEIAKLRHDTTKTSIISLMEAETKLNTYDIVIQTTSVGMKPNSNQSPIVMDKVSSSSIASDIVYQPINTRFLTEAKAHGAFTHLGHTMLLYQAQYAFEIWTNVKVSVNNMGEQLQQILEAR